MNAPLHAREVPVREGFARARDGVRLYYRAEGTGPALLCSNGIGVSTFFWAPLSRELSDQYTVVRWDYRGHGLSDDPRDPRSATVEECARGALAVLDELGIERAALLGHSMGSQVHFEVYRTAPDRVAALVPTLGTYRRAVETFFGTAASLKVFELMRHAVPAAPRLVQRATATVMRSSLADATARIFRLVHPDLCPKDALVPYFAHNTRLDPLLFLSLAESMQAHDATGLLPEIRVPTLVVAGDRDLFTPLQCAREMAQLIPGAELFVIPGGSHAALVEQPLLLSLRVRKFIEERVQF